MFLPNRTLRPVNLTEFGGLVTLVDRMDLTPPASPDCQNVEFLPGAVKSRGGTSLVLTGGSAYEFVGMDSLQLPAGRRLIAAQQSGTIYEENPEGTLTEIDTLVFAADARHRIHSTALFNRLCICGTQNGGLGTVEPRTWDGTNNDRFTYSAPGDAPLMADSANAGNVAAGSRIGAVCFVMRSGYVTPPAWTATFNTAGGFTLDVSNIPIGPPATVGRMLFVATPSASGTFDSSSLYHIPAIMLINDNTTTTTEIDFTEDQLLAGEVLSNFVGYDALSDVIQVIYYSGRAIAIGEVPHIRSRDNAKIFTSAVAPESAQALNLRFDAGPDVGGTPNAWSVVGGSVNGAFVTADGAVNPVWEITSDGATADQGYIRNGQIVGDSILEAAIGLNEEVGARIRLCVAEGTPTTGNIHISLRDSNAVPTFDLTADFPVNLLRSGWFHYTATLGTLASYGDNLCFDYVMDDPADAGVKVQFGGVEFYRTAELNGSVEGNSYMRASVSLDPQTFDTTTGFIGVGVGDGQNVRAAFVIGSTLFPVKERSLWAVTDDGATEPSNWLVQKVSDTVGCYTPRCIGYGDGWVAILSRDGLYRFDGSGPVKLSKEIQPTWDNIKWNYAHLFWCVVDESKQKIRCGVMTGVDNGIFVLDTVLTLDYLQGFGEQQRRWTKDTGTPAALCCALVERADGSRRVFFGQPEFIYQYEPDGHNDGDDDTAIDSYYETAPLGLEHGVTLTGGITLFVSGEGALQVSHVAPDGTETLFWQPDLEDPARKQREKLMNVNYERVGIIVGTETRDFYWSLKRLQVWQKGSPYYTYRGRA